MRDSFNEINITPLTDIFLVLLIIMMVIAPLLERISPPTEYVTVLFSLTRQSASFKYLSTVAL